MKPYSKQFRECYSDGTAKKMTDERIAKMKSSDRKMIDAILTFRSQNQIQYSGGPLFCGKKPGICSAKHCRLITA